VRELLATVDTWSAQAVVLVSHLVRNRAAAVSALREVEGRRATLFFSGAAFLTAATRQGLPGHYLGATSPRQLPTSARSCAARDEDPPLTKVKNGTCYIEIGANVRLLGPVPQAWDMQRRRAARQSRQVPVLRARAEEQAVSEPSLKGRNSRRAWW
jgi:hypothetical protein